MIRSQPTEEPTAEPRSGDFRTSDRRGNLILGGLPAPSARELDRYLRVVQLEAGTTLVEQDEPITQFVFPFSAAISLLTVLDSGAVHEHIMVGHDGMIGFASLLGERLSPFRGLVQVSGEAAVLTLSDAPPNVLAALERVAGRYAVMMLRLTGQAATCSSHHLVEQRIARMLLRLDDVTGRPDLPITHEFVALLLGVQRQTVTLAAGKLQKDGLIRYGRGQITIVDRPGLEAASCECYRAMRRSMEWLFD